MRKTLPALFRRRHFQDHVIVLCVRWYLRYCLTLRDLEELMAERGLDVDHSTIGRWVLRYAPELYKRIRRDTRTPNRSWRVDETYVRVAGRWTYLYRAVDSSGETIDFMLSPKRDAIAAKQFLQMALWRVGGLRPRVDQCGRASCLSTSNAGAEGEWRAESSLPVSAVGVLEQYARARPPIPEETNGHESVVPIGGWCLGNHRGL